jgi:hypothetical protein
MSESARTLPIPGTQATARTLETARAPITVMPQQESQQKKVATARTPAPSWKSTPAKISTAATESERPGTSRTQATERLKYESWNASSNMDIGQQQRKNAIKAGKPATTWTLGNSKERTPLKQESQQQHGQQQRKNAIKAGTPAATWTTAKKERY